jgi:predicted PurR-regulated permease PerM
MMAYVVNLFLISLILTLMLLPAMKWLKTKGLSDFIAVTFLSVIALVFFVIFVVMVYLSFNLVMNDLPKYEAELALRITETAAMLGTDPTTAMELIRSSIDIGATIQMAFTSALQAGEIAFYIFFITVLTFFMLLEAPKMPARSARFVGGNLTVMSEVTRMSQYIIDFMIVRTETNIIHGFLFGGSLLVMGVHGAPLWGLLTFVLGYIPFIGLIIASVPAIIFAYIQFGVWGAVAVIVLVCVLNLIIENPVFSYLASRRFEMPPLVVILSVIFWGWLLGIAGMFFSVPITLLMMIVFQCSDDLRGINTLLGVSSLFEGKHARGGSETPPAPPHP